VGLERGPPSLVSTTEELLGRKSSGSGVENREYYSRDPSRRPRGTLYTQNLAFTSPTSGGRFVGIVRSRTQDTGFSLAIYILLRYVKDTIFRVHTRREKSNIYKQFDLKIL
jgi:hypothetical protein